MASDRTSILEQRTRYDPAEVEPRMLARWLEAGYFHPGADGSPDENYSIAIPPPNVTGSLHMGHALNGTIQDVLIRHHRMRGERTKWIFGTDHAGIATQTQVERQLASEGTSREQIGRETFLERVWQWREHYGSTIVEQFQRLGASCDYADERFTMDDGYADAVQNVFVDLYERGLIYRDHYMVNWDPGSRSAISDLEVADREVTDALYYIDYPLEDGSGAVTVATVRPETMLADTAVAVNPDDERYEDVIGKHVTLPLVGRRLEVIADEYVKTDFGTGALKITPGHDPNDFEIGRRHRLEEISVIGEDGRMTVEAGEFAGINVSEASEAVVAALEREGLVSKKEDYTHTVPFSHRSGERIEPLISLQWFMKMDELAAPAIEAVRDGRVRFVPERWARVYLDWLENIKPWCVSRQLWWGHRLPVWYCDACEETYVSRTAPERCGSCDGTLRRDEDVLDTWFSSALWPFATLGWPQDSEQLRAFYPTDVLVTARDIIFLWVARMVMMGIEFAGEVPFSDVYITSIIQAPDGRRMSKSLGTGIDPLDEIETHGADAVRFGLLAMSSSQDVRYSAEKIRQGQQFANKMWNASRLVLMNASGARPAARAETVEDRWILSRLQRAIADVTARTAEYDFSHAAQTLYSFFWSELCDWYLEMVKPRLYSDDQAEREAVASNLLFVLERTLALAHPFVPFVTEEIWSFLPDRDSDLAVSEFPQADEALLDESAEREIELVIEVTRRLRNYRDSVGAQAASVLRARVVADSAARSAYERSLETIGRLARFDLELTAAAGGEDQITVAVPAALIEVLGGEVDPAEARRNLEARRTELNAEIGRAEGKLANEGFVAKAPPELVQTERDKLERLRKEIDELEG
ncbi:MAG: valine--tRNA ligase [Solirubrobacterales bacterium]